MRKPTENAIYKRAGSRNWQLRWTDAAGREVRISAGTEDYTEAQAILKAHTEGSGLTVLALAERFFEQHPMKPKTKQCYKTSLQAWLPYIEGVMIERFGRSHIQQFVSDRLKTVAQGTIRNDLAFMSSMFSFAELLPGSPTVNPVSTFSKRKLKVANKRLRWLTEDEEARLLEVISIPWQQLMVLLGIDAGLRKGEILKLRVSQVNLRARTLTLYEGETKTGRGRTVPLSNRLHSTLSAHCANLKPSQYLFVNSETKQPYTTMRQWFDQAVVDADIADFTFHDTRHTFASRYVQRGGRLQPLQELMGHSSLQMTTRYAHLAPGNAIAEFRLIEAKTDAK